MIRAGAAFLAALLAVLLLPVAPARADAWRDRQWYFAPLRVAEAQRLGHGGAGVIVAVIDTGVDTTHPDLRGATVAGRVMSVDQPTDDRDTGPHGTGMAVLIGGRGHGRGAGLLGIAPRSTIMPIRPVNDQMLVASGIRWAVRNGARVINMSFVLKTADAPLRQAIAEAVAADVVLVGAAGNDNGPVIKPTIFDGVLGVGTVGRDNQPASFTNHGRGVDLVTYGTDMPVARPGGRYAVANGTSDSSALVAGAAALIRARFPDMSAAEVADRLTGTATDDGPAGWDDYYGYGRLNLIAALTAPRKPPPSATADAVHGDGGPAPAPQSGPGAAPESRPDGPSPSRIVSIGVMVLFALGALLLALRARRIP